MKPLEYWTPDTFDVVSYTRDNSPYSDIFRTPGLNLKYKINKSFNTCGFDKSGKCVYTYNELGYRGDSIHKSGFKILSIGCSMTEGAGVNDNETWSHQFTKLIENGVDFNLGLSGRSNDYITRVLITFYNLLKPDLVLIMYTSPLRREIYTKDGGIEPYRPGMQWGYMKETEDGRKIQNHLIELQNDNEDFINWYKNHQLIKLFLESKGCNWLWNGWFGIPKEYKEYNRFDGMYGDFIDKGIDNFHPGSQHNYQYSKVLFNYIYKNFRYFLPDSVEPIKSISI